MDLKDLKQGDKFYYITYLQVKWFTYLCVHPQAENYHIIIDENLDPIRIFHLELLGMVNANLRTYDEAKLVLANKLEVKVKSLRESVENK